MEHSNRTSLHENRQIKCQLPCSPRPSGSACGNTIPPESIRWRLSLCRPPRHPPEASGFPASRQKQARDVVGFYNRTTYSPLGPIAEESLWHDPQAVRQEWVLCKSILSPQREPTGESIIRRNKPPMLPESDCFCSEILPAGRKNSKIFPMGFHVVSCLGEPPPALSTA
jgi:hypothetical protein